MNPEKKSTRRKKLFASRVSSGERGQAIVLAAVFVTGMFCMCGFTIDVGRVYISFHELQSSTDAAALAGGWALSEPGSTTATVQSAAAKYSSSTSGSVTGVNTPGVMTNLGITTTPKCLTTLANAPFGIPCFGAGAYNAVVVNQTSTVPVTFARFFGAGDVALSATSTASMSGVPLVQYNVAIVVDTTASMNDSDSGSGCSGTRLSCALSGVKTLLGGLFPCSTSLGCGNTYTTGQPTNAFDHVSLFTFPDVTTTTVANDTNCSGSDPTNQGYSFPPNTAGLSGYTPIAPSGKTTKSTYQVVSYTANFRASNTSSGSTLLNGSSTVVDAVGGKSGCASMSAPGGAGTYYAGAIYAAQQSLVAEQASLPPGTQNIIILISDGDASSGYVTTPVTNSRNTYSSDMPGASLTTGTYPSVLNQCQQAVTAATAAKAAGTQIYSIAYGAESSGCATDSSGITPCQTMEGIASTPLSKYFFSDYAQSGGGVSTSCIGQADPTTNINRIFSDILSNFSVSRLVPNGIT